MPVALAALFLIFAGCSEEPSRLVPVSGVVTRDGVPLAGALVEFEPVPGRAGDPSFNPSSTGTTDEEGRYTLETPFGSGAVAGEHAVKIWETVKVQSEEELAPGEELVLRLLPEFAEKGRRFNLSEEGAQDADFALQSTPEVTPQAEIRQLGADPQLPSHMPTRGHPGSSDRIRPPISRTLWCAITIALWLITLVGCFKWWKYNQRRLLERT